MSIETMAVGDHRFGDAGCSFRALIDTLYLRQVRPVLMS